MLKASIIYNGPIEAPIKKDQIVGKFIVTFNNEVNEFDLLAFENIKKVNIISRLIKSLSYLVWGDA